MSFKNKFCNTTTLFCVVVLVLNTLPAAKSEGCHMTDSDGNSIQLTGSVRTGTAQIADDETIRTIYTYTTVDVQNVSEEGSSSYLAFQFDGETLEISLKEEFKTWETIEMDDTFTSLTITLLTTCSNSDTATLTVAVRIASLSNNYAPNFTNVDDSGGYTITLPMPLSRGYMIAGECGKKIEVQDFDYNRQRYNSSMKFETQGDTRGIQAFLIEELPVGKKFYVRLETMQTLSTENPFKFTLIATDVAPSSSPNDPPLSSSVTVTIKPDIEASTPLVPVFENVLYNIDITYEERTVYPLTLNFEEGYDKDDMEIKFIHRGGEDLTEYFSMVPQENYAELQISAGIPDEKLQAIYGMVVLEATRTGQDRAGYAVVHITLPGSQVTTPEPTTPATCPTTIEVTECPTATECPTVTCEECQTITECPTATECPTVTECPTITCEPCTTLTEDTIVTECPDCPTQCPTESSTLTECPTQCPECPTESSTVTESPTKCPVCPTECSTVTECPTHCPECPPESSTVTECPTQCPECPPESSTVTECPTLCPTECSTVTECPTQCPECSPESSTVTEYPTQCPECPTECSTITECLTQCPTAAECPTECPPVTECPTVVENSTTEYPTNSTGESVTDGESSPTCPTVCPTYQEECPPCATESPTSESTADNSPPSPTEYPTNSTGESVTDGESSPACPTVCPTCPEECSPSATDCPTTESVPSETDYSPEYNYGSPAIMGYPDLETSMVLLPQYLMRVEATVKDLGVVPCKLTSTEFEIDSSTGIIYPRAGTFKYEDTDFSVLTVDEYKNDAGLQVSVRILKEENMLNMIVEGYRLTEVGIALEEVSSSTSYNIKTLSATLIAAAVDDDDKNKMAVRNKRDTDDSHLLLVAYGYDKNKKIVKSSEIIGAYEKNTTNNQITLRDWNANSVVEYHDGSEGSAATIISLAVVAGILAVVSAALVALYIRLRRNGNDNDDDADNDFGNDKQKLDLTDQEDGLSTPIEGRNYGLQDIMKGPSHIYDTVTEESEKKGDDINSQSVPTPGHSAWTVLGSFERNNMEELKGGLSEEEEKNKDEDDDDDDDDDVTNGRKKSVVTFNDNIERIEIEHL